MYLRKILRDSSRDAGQFERLNHRESVCKRDSSKRITLSRKTRPVIDGLFFGGNLTIATTALGDSI